MLAWFRSRLTFANVVSLTALFVALSGGAYALSHRHAEARAIRKALAGEAATRYIPSYWVALVDHTLGESEQALDGLEQAALARYPQIAYLGVEPIFDTLRAHPRFAALLQQIDIPSAAAATRLPASETDS